MPALQTLTEAAKQSTRNSYGTENALKSAIKAWLDTVRISGRANTDTLRSWALLLGLTRREFAEQVNLYLTDEATGPSYYTGYRAEICHRCAHLEWNLNMHTVYNDLSVPRRTSEAVKVCHRCVSNYYRSCDHCSYWYENQDVNPEALIYIHNCGYICPVCRALTAFRSRTCEGCSRNYLASSAHIHPYVQDSEFGFIDDPQGTHFFCINCRTPEKSRCKPLHPEFRFPALMLPGDDKTVGSDEIFEIATGGGEVSRTGLVEIHNYIANATRGNSDRGLRIPELANEDFDFDVRWMTREGNMPKRLAKLLLNTYNLKLNENLMSEIGNIAQRYTSKPGTYRLSLTRKVNRPREEFVNGDSCWWTNYWYSRCSLKSLGGFGLRTWNEMDRPIGRAWMIPLGVQTRHLSDTLVQVGLVPSPETLPADAYIIFNGYGPNNTRLDSMEFGRMVATMTGKSYRKINLSARGRNGNYMYINGTTTHQDSVGKGILVAAQEVCDAIPEFTVTYIPNQCSCGGR